jgi:acylphosphatase
MSNLNDAIEILLLNDDDNIERFYSNLQQEIEKYKDKEVEKKYE